MHWVATLLGHPFVSWATSTFDELYEAVLLTTITLCWFFIYIFLHFWSLCHKTGHEWIVTPFSINSRWCSAWKFQESDWDAGTTSNHPRKRKKKKNLLTSCIWAVKMLSRTVSEPLDVVCMWSVFSYRPMTGCLWGRLYALTSRCT